MTRSVDKVTRFDASLVDSAIAEGRRQHRTGRQQLEYWARVGQSITAQESAAVQHVRDALAGRRPVEDLTEPEGRLFNAEIDAGIADSLEHDDYAQALAAQGVTTAIIDDDGRIVEQRPDGTTRVIAG